MYRNVTGYIFDQVKHMLRSKNERRFKPVGGIDGGVVFHETIEVTQLTLPLGQPYLTRKQP